MSVDETSAVAEQISTMRLGSQEVLPSIGGVAMQFINAVTGDTRTIKTGITKLDENTGGLERQTLSVLAGRPSMGKTGLALGVARAAADDGHKVIFISLEMSAVNLWARLACGDAEIAWQDVKAHKINQEQEARLLQTSDHLSAIYDGKLVIDDRLPRSTADVWRITAQQHFDLVIADHIRIFSDPHERETKRLGLITERLKAAAKANNCHIMVLSQMSRGVEDRNDKRPTLADLRDSGEIEENADQVFMLYRDDYYNPKTNPGDTSITELWIRKHRDGIKDAKVLMAYHLKRQKFYPATEKNINLNDFTV
jgi:replicative DNA helicase